MNYILDSMIIIDALNRVPAVLDFLKQAGKHAHVLFLSNAVEFEILVGFRLNPDAEREEGFHSLCVFLRSLTVEREDWVSAGNLWGDRAASELSRTKDAKLHRGIKSKFKRLKVDYLLAAQQKRTGSKIVTRDAAMASIADVHFLQL